MSSRDVMEATGPIFLDQLQCTGRESSLLDCSNGLPALGVVSCSHAQDVKVRCTGITRCTVMY